MGMYKGRKFTKKQLTFIAEAILSSALDMTDSGLPDSISWEDYKGNASGQGYHTGAVESAGMALAIVAAQLINDGVGVYDALAMAGNFDTKIDLLFQKAWEDQGVAVNQRHNDLAKKLEEEGKHYQTADLYPGYYPDVHACAVTFAEVVFKDQV